MYTFILKILIKKLKNSIPYKFLLKMIEKIYYNAHKK